MVDIVINESFKLFTNTRRLKKISAGSVVMVHNLHPYQMN